MPLPSCECNNGLPIQQQLANIYCVLLEILNAGGEIEPSQITGITPVGINLLTGISNPATPVMLEVQTNGVVLVRDAGDVAAFLTGGAPGFTGTIDTTATPSIDVANGSITGAS